MSTSLEKIEHIIVLMLENRSFDHLFGYLKMKDGRIAGITDHEFANYSDANSPAPVSRWPVQRANEYVIPFDPGHEFRDVQYQLYGPQLTPPFPPNLPSVQAPMNGFVYRAMESAVSAQDASLVMGCFQSDQVPLLSTLANEYSLFNFWYSSMPGPTWPNRFFVHAGTSGGLIDSPTEEQILHGYSFNTIYHSLDKAQLDWRIYHDGLPQAAGIDELRLEYVNPFTKHFRSMQYFVTDVRTNSLPPYVFIEPFYDVGHNYTGGNSMHPLNDIRRGEMLVKHVYETVRQSSIWDKMMFVVTFDEHGGFYDHISPPRAVPTGDDLRYANPHQPFEFTSLGVRVPAIVVSPYTERGTVIGDVDDPRPVHFDHTSILATVEKRYNLAPLTTRDNAATDLGIALNRSTLRSSSESLMTLPDPVRLNETQQLMPTIAAAAAPNALLSKNQRSMLALAVACDLKVTPVSEHARLQFRHQSIERQGELAAYMKEVEHKIQSRRVWDQR